MIDPREFSIVYNEHFDKVFHACLQQVSDAETARELTQEIFQSVWERRAELVIKEGYEQYLLRAARYKVIDWYRKKSVIEKHEAHIAATQPLAEVTTEIHVHFKHLQQRVDQLVDLLPEKCKTVYVLGREKGYSTRQIATSLFISEKTVKNHMNRALSFLRLHLQSYR